MSAILKEDPPDLSVTNQDISPGLERIVRHCLEKNPERRFQSARDLAFALQSLSECSGTVGAGALGPPSPPNSARSPGASRDFSPERSRRACSRWASILGRSPGSSDSFRSCCAAGPAGRGHHRARARRQPASLHGAGAGRLGRCSGFARSQIPGRKCCGEPKERELPLLVAGRPVGRASSPTESSSGSRSPVGRP